MTLVRGHVKDGRIVLDDPVDLPEGAAVEIAVLGDDGELSAEERAEAEAAIDEGIDQAERGETSPIEDVLRRLRANG
jgi:hypothetical protein